MTEEYTGTIFWQVFKPSICSVDAHATSLRLPLISASMWWTDSCALTASHLHGLSCFFWLLCLSGLPRELSQPMSKHNPETGGQREINSMEPEGSTSRWLTLMADKLVRLLARHLSSFPCGVSTGLIECVFTARWLLAPCRGAIQENREKPYCLL